MKISAALACFVVAIVASLVSQTSAETVQTAADVFNTRPFLWLEAESFSTLTNGAEATGWKVVSKESPINSIQGLPILAATSNVSGAALLDQIGGGRDTALYQVKFITAGTYQLFTRHSMYDSAAVAGNYGNEDSIYLSPAFNKNSSADWIGVEGVAFDGNDISWNVDLPTPGFAADPDGFKPTTGDSSNDGWYATRDWGVKSLGTVTFPNNALGTEWNGNFNWYNRPFFVGAAPAGGFNSDFEFKTEYVVTEAMLGQTLTFEMATRENYVVMDGFLFIQTSNIYPTSDLLDLYSQADLDAGILPQPVNADYNNNGVVDGADYVLWRNGGPLQNDATPGVQPADYNVWRAAFGNTSGSGAGVGGGAVPEPAALVLFAIGIAACQAARQPRRR